MGASLGLLEELKAGYYVPFMKSKQYSGSWCGLTDFIRGTLNLTQKYGVKDVIVMLHKYVKLFCAIGCTAALLATIIIQHNIVKALREQTIGLKQKVESLSDLEANNEALSNNLVETIKSQSVNNEPSEELLRLRGVVAVLRQQLLEISVSRTQMYPPIISSKHLQEIKDTRPLAKASYEEAKALSEQLTVRLANNETLSAAILAIGIQDKRLEKLIEERESLSRAIESDGKFPATGDSGTPARVDDLENLNKKIEGCAEGIRVGIDLRASSLKAVLLRMDEEEAKAKGNSF